jgi:haloalkane dehalogenase
VSSIPSFLINIPTMAQPYETDVSPDFPFELQRVNVLESYMTYIDTGARSTNRQEIALLIHGNPVSTYLWRNIIPHLSPSIRCIAPDLIGFGSSGKPSIPYTVADHAAYLSAFISQTIPPNAKIILIIQDFGSLLGFNWASQNPERVAGIAFWEFLRPFENFEDFVPEPSQTNYKKFRNPVQGRELIVEQNAMIERVIPNAMLRPLSKLELDNYRKPFLEKRDREVLLKVPAELPIAGEPKEVWELAVRYHEWLLRSEVPKLLFWGRPGRLLVQEKARWYAGVLRNCKDVCVGEGLHFLEEDHPKLMGRELKGWIEGL